MRIKSLIFLVLLPVLFFSPVMRAMEEEEEELRSSNACLWQTFLCSGMVGFTTGIVAGVKVFDSSGAKDAGVEDAFSTFIFGTAGAGSAIAITFLAWCLKDNIASQCSAHQGASTADEIELTTYGEGAEQHTADV